MGLRAGWGKRRILEQLFPESLLTSRGAVEALEAGHEPETMA